MGQKTNPLGFRLGTTQSHHSVWFEEPKNYSVSLQEDEKIRNFFQNYVQNSIDNYIKKKKNKNKKKAKKINKNRSKSPSRNTNKRNNNKGYEGVVRVEIKKQIVHTKRTFIKLERFSDPLQIQKAIIRVIIYSGSLPKFLLKKEIWERDVKKQEFFYIYSKKIIIQFKKVQRPYSQPNLIAKFITLQLKERIPFRRIMHQAIELARKEKNTKGMRIRIAGRIEGKDKARKVGRRKGKLPLQRIYANIDYCCHTIQTIYGVLGLKIWILRK
uniref:Small ribosomal subunit protein uS3c n=1 Tax=Juncus effusus TaxID=13579 RepID=A0A8A3SRQ8_JUNEF|nr:ribosomal protein S3 [Juncus effusus]QSZ78303.1 ribosomal protein S3 [Juncus effusus]